MYHSFFPLYIPWRITGEQQNYCVGGGACMHAYLHAYTTLYMYIYGVGFEDACLPMRVCIFLYCAQARCTNSISDVIVVNA